MQLTNYTEYALRVLIYSALHDDRRATIHEMSCAYGISKNHLMKVVHQLSQHGWVVATRGRGGGVRLAQSPETIYLGAVVRDMEPQFHIAGCFNEATNQCPITPVCGLTGVLHVALEAFLAVLDQCSLADVIKRKSALIQLLASPTDLRTHSQA